MQIITRVGMTMISFILLVNILYTVIYTAINSSLPENMVITAPAFFQMAVDNFNFQNMIAGVEDTLPTNQTADIVGQIQYGFSIQITSSKLLATFINGIIVFISGFPIFLSQLASLVPYYGFQLQTLATVVGYIAEAIAILFIISRFAGPLANIFG